MLALHGVLASSLRHALRPRTLPCAASMAAATPLPRRCFRPCWRSAAGAPRPSPQQEALAGSEERVYVPLAAPVANPREASLATQPCTLQASTATLSRASLPSRSRAPP